MFSEEISRNPDFAHLARGQQQGRSSQRVRDGRPTVSQNGGGVKAPDIDIMKSLGDLGNNARRRLQMLASQFNSKTRGSGAGDAGPDGAAAGSSTAERRGLLDGETNEDDVALEFATRKDL
mmetsp:Transcript_22814/g.49789  ORF Transcript_22814/g.49789 Transcript_22814/m.49789 type:complete len:121 (+) Transcript_22814:53-415(+)